MCVFWCTTASIPRPWTYAPTRLAMSVDFGGFFWGEKELVGNLGEVQCILIVIKCWSTVDQMLIMIYHEESHLSIPYSTMLCRFLVNCSMPTSGAERGRASRLFWNDQLSFFAVPSWGSPIVREYWRGDWQLDGGTKEFYSSKTWCFLQFLAFIPPESCFFILEHVSLAIRFFLGARPYQFGKSCLWIARDHLVLCT